MWPTRCGASTFNVGFSQQLFSHCGKTSHVQKFRDKSYRSRGKGAIVTQALSGGNFLRGSSPEEPPNPSVEAAFSMTQSLVTHFLAAELDHCVAYMSQDCVDRCIERKIEKSADNQLGKSTLSPENTDVLFKDVLQFARPLLDFYIDSYGYRGLVFSSPKKCSALSSLRVAPNKFLQRYQVLTSYGEEMILTFHASIEDGLEPRYRGMRLVKRWFIKEITGEPADSDIPLAPGPQIGPESVVLAQLDGLHRQNAAAVFAFASPNNAAVTGPLERFEGLLHQPPYASLLGHRHAEILRSVQLKENRALILVGVTGSEAAADKMVFAWSMRLQDESEVGFENTWLTDSVQLVTGGSSGQLGLY